MHRRGKPQTLLQAVRKNTKCSQPEKCPTCETGERMYDDGSQTPMRKRHGQSGIHRTSKLVDVKLSSVRSSGKDECLTPGNSLEPGSAANSPVDAKRSSTTEST
eukprot:UN04295